MIDSYPAVPGWLEYIPYEPHPSSLLCSLLLTQTSQTKNPLTKKPQVTGHFQGHHHHCFVPLATATKLATIAYRTTSLDYINRKGLDKADMSGDIQIICCTPPYFSTSSSEQTSEWQSVHLEGVKGGEYTRRCQTQPSPLRYGHIVFTFGFP